MSAKKAAAKTLPALKRKRGAPLGNKNAKGGKREGAGRPKGTFKLKADNATLATVETLGKIQATNKEAGARLGVTEETFVEFLRREEKAAETFEFAKEVGKASLRSAQFKAALAGNPTMLIWMGKQLLGQTDKITNQHTGPNGGPMMAMTGEMTAKEAAEAYSAMIRGQ
jgi:hypothetical protein